MAILKTIFAVAFTFGAITGASAEVYRLQTSQNAGEFSLQYLQNVWVPRLSAMSGGEIELELLPINSVVPSAEGLDALATGIIDGLHDSISRSTGKDPAYGMLADMVAAYNNADQGQTMCMNAGGKEFLQKLNDKYTGGMVHVVGCSPYTRESFPSSVPIRSVADMKGLKIRAPEGLPAELFARAGATSVPIPFSEVYTSLEKGVIDAADASSYINNSTSGLHKVAPYPIQPGIHSQAILFLAFNKGVWDGFTPAQQEMINVWYMAALPDLRRYSKLEDNKVLVKDRSGTTEVKEVINWPDEERAKFRSIAKSVWEDYAKLSPLSQEAYDLQINYLRDAGLLRD